MRVRLGAFVALATLGLAAAIAAPATVAGAAQVTETTSTAEVVAGDSGHDDADAVYEVVKTAKGFDVAIYDAAPGVSNDELRATLAAQGHKPLAKGDQPAAAIARQSTGLLASVAAVSSACQYYGSAAEWCGHRWAANGFEDPAVYFLDHTSSAWPVSAATVTWNKAQGIDSYYRWYTNGCPGGGRHCVNLYNANYGATGWTGTTHWGVDSTGNYDNTTNVTVKFNDYYGGTAAQHRNTTCHEMGHALGLAHNYSTASCLYYARTSQQYPSSDDFGILPLIYGY
jgi:hypothetical protein